MKSDQIAAKWQGAGSWHWPSGSVLPEGIALAIPKDPPPKPEIQTPDSGRAAALPGVDVEGAGAPPRRRRRRPTGRAPKPAPGAAAATPDSDLSNNSLAQVAPAPWSQAALRRGGRVEFDGRLVQGQTAKSGAIYLFARKRSELKSMVEERTKYRKEILRTVDTNWSREAK